MKFIQKRTAYILGTACCFATYTLSTAAVAADRFDGLWLSDGYSYYLEAHGSKIRVSEISSISCIESFVATRQKPTVPMPFERYVSAQPSIGEGVSAYQLHLDAADQRLRVRPEGGISDIVFSKTKLPPTFCGEHTKNTPQYNYAVFWQTWAENYPFFALRKTNWMVIDEQNRQHIKATIPPKTLFYTLEKMISPFHDAHTSIADTAALSGKKNGLSFGGYRLPASGNTSPPDQKVLAILKARYFKTPLKSFCNDQIQFALMANSVGYMRIASFANYTKSSDFLVQLAALEQALDEIFTTQSPLNGLIIDVRLNGGGSDVFARTIAGRLTNKKYLAFTKVARNDIVDKGSRTKGQDAFVTVSKRPSFLGKVFLLTGNDSISAAETFAMALMGREPRVLRVGEPTQGVFSDVLSRKLPNGWYFGLPNEIYLTKAGRAFDGNGVLPDIKAAVFPALDLAQGRDTAVDMALSKLNTK